MSEPVQHLPRVLTDDAPGLSLEQTLQEEAMREVDATVLNIEQAIRRADQARRRVARGTAEPNFLRALDDAIKQLEQTRRTLQQQTLFGQAQQRLL